MIVQDEVSFVKVKNGSDGSAGSNGKDGANGKDSNMHTAYSWSADGTDRFTPTYPNENLLVKKNTDDKKYLREDGVEVVEMSWSITDYILVDKDDVLIVFGYSNLGFNPSACFYDSNKKFLSGIKANGNSATANLKVPQNAKFVRYSILSSDLQNKVKIEKSLEPTIYTPSPQDDFNNAWPTYSGTYSSHDKVQSQNPKDYTWARIRGADGLDGKDGQTPKDVISGYLSNEAIIVPATPTGAVTDYSKAFGDFFVFEGQDKKNSGVTYSKISEVNMTSTINSAGRYVVTALSADTGTATYRATYAGVTVDKILIVVKNKQGPSGAKGDSGKDGIAGKDGIGLKSTVITYGISDSESTQPATWTSSVPSLVKGKYLWTKTVWEYTDNTNETGYTKTYIAKDGNNGTDGIAGKDGVGIKNTTFKYGISISGTTKPSNWSTTIPVVPEGQFLWTETTWTYTDNTSEKGYSVAKQGAKGPQGDKGATGKDGIAGKDGVGLKETIIRYASSTSGGVAPTNGWQSTVPTVAPGDFLWTRTTWAYTDNTSEDGYSVSRIGEDGNTGKDGIAGKDGVGIEDTTITYVGSTNGTTPPSTGWTSTIPTVVDGSYLWTKTVWLYTDKTSETGYSVAKMGVQGEKGDKGAKGEKGPQGDPTGITVSPTAPTNPYINMLWQNTGSSNGYLTGTVYQWNGVKWNTFIFSAENIVANTLSAISANLGNITAGNIKGATIEGTNIIGSTVETRASKVFPDLGAILYWSKLTDALRISGSAGQNRPTYETTYQLDGMSGFGSGPTGAGKDSEWDFGLNGLSYKSGGVTGIGKASYDFTSRGFNIDVGNFTVNDKELSTNGATQLSPASGFSVYSTYDENLPRARRFGKTVTLSGAFTNNNNIEKGWRGVIGYLPRWATPSVMHRVICQGSGSNTFYLQVKPNGELFLERYGTTDTVAFNSGAWLTINTTYLV